MQLRVDTSSILILLGLGLGYYYWRKNKPLRTLESTVSRYNPLTYTSKYMKEYTRTMPRFYQFESERLI